MYRNLKELIEQIYETAPLSRNISLEDIRAEVESRIGEKVSRTTVRRVLSDLGIVADKNKKRVWAYRHNPGRGE